MKEALFVKLHTPKWRQYESEKSQSQSPDELAQRFVEITNDLAYARTFYPNSKTTAYLNSLALGFHQAIYKNKREKKQRILNFWTTELPLLFYKHRKQLRYALVFFLLSVAIGVISAKFDDRFVRLILGDGYVEMTNRNIAKGDPFGVYKSQSEGWMFVGIAMNNLLVMVKTAILGIFLGVVTILYTMYNGVMVGAFHYLFFSKGLGLQSILVIWIHGTIEISCIVLAAAAGLVLAKGTLFPQTFSRMVAFKQSAKDAVKMVLGIMPLIVFAAILESFVTRHTEMPLAISCAILLGSFSFMLWYTVFYPRNLNKRSNFYEER